MKHPSSINLSLPLLPLALAFTIFCVAETAWQNDTLALTQFRLQTDTHGNLLSNWTGADACSAAWLGVECSPNGRVVGLSLPSLNLRGPIDSLSSLVYLRFLDLHENRLNGTLYPLLNCTSLELLYLSHNDFSGEIPRQISSLRLLLRLDISDNNIRGPIPNQVAKLTHLLTLRLQNNALSGHVPDISASLLNLTQLNVTNNELRGHVPDSMLSKFGNASFSGNHALCGSNPLPKCSEIEPDTETTITVPSKPSSFPQTSSVTLSDTPKKKGLRAGVIVAIVVAVCVAVLVVISFVVAHCCARGGGGYGSAVGSESGKRKSGSSSGSEKKVYGNGGNFDRDSDGTNTETERSKLVFFDRRNQFELEDLLRASAEMLGKGCLGTVYRAVLDDGCTVAVKRLKDANPCERNEFEQYMDVVGKLKHPNIVRLRAYYYAKEEKLLVYDYLPNGSLHALLHGNRGPGRIPLDWTTRISLVLGAARGLARIHAEYNASKIPHGNVKSSNVLLDKNGVALISDFGLSLLLNPAHAIARLGGYRAPEQVEVKRLSQEADVYAFGVLVLEVLTGRAPSTQYPSSAARPRVEDEGEVDLPKWVRSVVKEEWTAEVFDEELLRYKNIEEELVAMLHVGVACVAAQPEKRPSMMEVVKMVEDLRVEQSPLGEDYDEARSRNSLSPSLPTTEDGLA
ncbi:leucine-rich repeat receptor-like protein kinase PXC1 [Vigna radiata var. radiata]|uniref:Leucine-rich repeat receptor-like protein kinase PXC1 n=1 Tax=Vigna radiata var. radiata TaxID=3916 RepID=A0A1S3TR50_VIGRR|nr:leucine-rich repeat receptor-like protein kinase PXC1 [Vigna radiata var. radiata]